MNCLPQIGEMEDSAVRETRMKKMRKVLVLNADFQPMKFTSWKAGLIQTIVETKQSAYVVEYYDEWVILDASGREYQIPAVIALKKYVDIGNQKAPYTKSNVFVRDKMTCQYCGDKFRKEVLTIDHVIPRSRWKALGNLGRSSVFENVVASCKKCNSEKADRTCQESGMYPINTPRIITRREVFINRLKIVENIPKEWHPYIKGLTSV